MVRLGIAQARVRNGDAQVLKLRALVGKLYYVDYFIILRQAK